MCFNATVTTPLDVAQKMYNLKIEKELNFPFYNQHRVAFTNPFLPMIKEGRELDLGKWGLIPHWVRDCKKATEISKYTLNARVETINEKPSFKYSIDKSRVIVMFDGFYEWKNENGKKVPYYIFSSDSKPFIIAGLSSPWGGVDTLSIITTEAKGIMKEIHNSKERMPFFLKESQMDSWLDSTITFKDIIPEIKPEYRHIEAILQSPNL